VPDRSVVIAIARIALLSGSVLLAGCQLGYYSHLVGGHTRLMMDREPVDEVLARDDLSAELRQRLQLAQQLRDFASNALALPVEDAYADYVALERDWITWNLFAAPPLSLEPHSWCYPVVGCAHYRGYFDQARAERDAKKLRGKGLEVYASGAIAYSTLGWFDDPLTTPMLAGSELWFAELLFHELAHRRFYLKGDTRFNESLATSVAREGLRRWLAAQPQRRAEAEAQLARQATARQQVLDLVADTRTALETLYASSLPETEKLARRDALRADLRQRYRAALAANPALAGYQRWFDGPLNNAQLNTLADYEGWVPAFDAVLAACDGDWACFWQEVERMADLPAEQRQALLEKMND
jgi:predicted aminopeptidase